MSSFCKHHMFKNAVLVDELSAPLRLFGISYFSFMRCYKNGSHIRLANHPQWLQYYYQNNYHLISDAQLPERAGIFLWSSLERYPMFSKASNAFDLDNGAVVIVKDGDTVEKYSFGTNKSNTIVNELYLHHPEILYKFILYFKEKAFDLIHAAKMSPIATRRSNELTKMVIPAHNNMEEIIKSFLQNTQIKKVTANIDGEDIQLTSKEALILSLMKEGLTAQEISQEMNLKQNTIETYQIIIKEKLFLNKKSRLIRLVSKNNLIDKNILK